MINESKTKSFKTDSDFIKFRNYVNTLLFDIAIDMAIAGERGRVNRKKLLEGFVVTIKSKALTLHNDVQLEDDEYGTLAYTLYPRTYRQALTRFLEWLNHGYDVRPIHYEGELNSYDLRGLVDALARKERNIRMSREADSSCDDLPF